MDGIGWMGDDLSVATTSGVESSGSEPGSPSRPVTPMPPLPTHHHPPYDECIRAHDSEDSGLGPSPAKSVLGGRPGSPVSPIQFGSRCSDDSLLDLSPRTDNSYESEDNPKTDDAFYDGEDEDDLENDVPKSPPFKFLLSNNKDLRQFQSLSNSPMSTDEEDIQHFKTLEDPFRCGTTTTGPQPTKFPSPLVVTNFRCSGPTTNDDHGFRLCSPKDTSETFFDEQARQQEENSDKLKDILLKKHISQQKVVSSEVPEKLDDIFVNNYLNQQQICGELPTTNQTDKKNDHQVTKQQNVDSLTGHLQPECCDGVPSSNNQTDKLENHFLQNHLIRQLSNNRVSLNSLTDKSSNHSIQNHLNQQQISDVSNNRTDKLNSHVLQNHLNQQQPSNDELCTTNRTDKLSHHITQKLSNHRQSCSEQPSNNETDKLNSNFSHNHQNSRDIPQSNQTSDNFLQNHLNKQQNSEAELPSTDHFPASSSTDKQSDHHSFLQDHRRLNPKVVLIRSNLCGNYVEESSSSSSSRQSNSSHCSQSVTAPATSLDDGACKWLHCERSADANTKTTDLVDHIRQCHVREQSEEDGKSFVCLWVGCKVYDRPSSSRTWLERHVLLHGGSKPFRCIVDGCRQRFGSELVLERHVNSHFPQRTRGSALGQHCRKKNRHKHRKRPTSNKSKDFIDDATMEHVRHNLFLLSSVEGMNGPSSAITFHSNVIGRKMDNFGKVHLLLHWSPEDMLPDSWIPASEMASNLEKTIPVSRLPPSALQLPSMAPLAKTCFSQRPAKRKRK